MNAYNDVDGLPCGGSAEILDDLLRGELGFDGLVVTDAIIMEGLTEDSTEAAAAVRALAAGCDVLLYPKDMEGVIREVEAAVQDGRLSRERVADALRRTAAAAERVWGEADGTVARDEDRRWSLETGIRSLRVCRGDPRLPSGPVRLVEVEDDEGGPFPPYPRDALPAALRRAGVELSDAGTPLVALYSDIRAWKGRPGISAAARQRVREVTAEAPGATVLLFSHPRLAHELPTAAHLLAAWGGEGIMQEAVAAWLTGQAGAMAGAGGGIDR
jgi:hypothetical protein